MKRYLQNTTPQEKIQTNAGECCQTDIVGREGSPKVVSASSLPQLSIRPVVVRVLLSTVRAMTSLNAQYSKWDNIELSDDESDCHPVTFFPSTSYTYSSNNRLSPPIRVVLTRRRPNTAPPPHQNIDKESWFRLKHRTRVEVNADPRGSCFLTHHT